MFVKATAILFATSMHFYSRYFVPICHFSHYSQQFSSVVIQLKIMSCNAIAFIQKSAASEAKNILQAKDFGTSPQTPLGPFRTGP